MTKGSSKPNKTRLCPLHLSRQEMTCRHRIKEEWLDKIQSGHCDTEEIKLAVKVGMRICCRHFVAHTHPCSTKDLILFDELRPKDIRKRVEPSAPRKEKQAAKKTTSERSCILNQQAAVVSHTTIEIFRESPRVRQSTNEKSRSSLSKQTTQHPAVSEVLNILKDPTLSIASLEPFVDAVASRANDQDNQSVPLSEFLHVLKSISIASQSEKKLTFENFKHRRGDIYVWTGFKSCEQLEEELIFPLTTYLQGIENSNQLPASTVPIADRVLWLMFFLNSNSSFTSLHTHLIETGTNTGQLSSLTKLLRNTAKMLAAALQPTLSLPTLDTWRENNKNTGMEAYPNDLFLILDGTSLPIRRPKTNEMAKDMYVVYKGHHAWRYFIAVLSSGKIVFLSDLERGCISDAEAYNNSNLRTLLGEMFSGIELDALEKLTLVGDKGYIYIIPPEGWDLLITKTGLAELRSSKDGQTSQPSSGDPGETGLFVRRFETEVAVPRAVVERTISLVKKWPRLSSPCSNYKQGDLFLRNLVFIACYLANLTIEKLE